jgi:hypothetical protein
MYEGYVDRISRNTVEGWALNTEALDQSVEIAVLLDGAPMCRITANLSRPDVAAAKQLQSALCGFSVNLPPLLDSAAGHHVQVRFAETNLLIPNGERKFPALDAYDHAPSLTGARALELAPLFVSHQPRSGSTMCMALLHRHPSIVVAEHYPFEVKPATYYARAARLLTFPANHEHSASPTEFTRDALRLGFNPFNHWSFDDVYKDAALRDHFFERSARSSLFDALRSVSADYYQHLAADQKKLAASFFAEKCEVQGDTRRSVLALFPEAREILLIRDPRDILCSALAYFRPSTDEDLMPNLRNGCETLRHIAEEENGRTIVVKYEDLVCNQVSTLRKIAEFLGISTDTWFAGPIDDSQMFATHATTRSPVESIGRWREELSAEQKNRSVVAFSKFLLEFGYNDSPL